MDEQEFETMRDTAMTAIAATVQTEATKAGATDVGLIDDAIMWAKGRTAEIITDAILRAQPQNDTDPRRKALNAVIEWIEGLGYANAKEPTLRDCTDWLNDNGYRTLRGRQWSDVQVHRLLLMNHVNKQQVWIKGVDRQPAKDITEATNQVDPRAQADPLREALDKLITWIEERGYANTTEPKLRECADWLNDNGYTTVRGKQWSDMTVNRLFAMNRVNKRQVWINGVDRQIADRKLKMAANPPKTTHKPYTPQNYLERIAAEKLPWEKQNEPAKDQVPSFPVPKEAPRVAGEAFDGWSALVPSDVQGGFTLEVDGPEESDETF